MAKVAKRKQTSKGLRLEVVNPNAAGIDISPKEMQVCVPSDRDGECNRTFGVYTEDLHYIAEWLKACCIDTVAMESTGIYWLPVFRILKESGFDVILVNASDVKNFSGRKTDASDAEWLMMLHSYGLLKPCFRLTRQSPWRSLTKTPTIFNGLSFKFATFATWNIKQT